MLLLLWLARCVFLGAQLIRWDIESVTVVCRNIERKFFKFAYDMMAAHIIVSEVRWEHTIRLMMGNVVEMMRYKSVKCTYLFCLCDIAFLVEYMICGVGFSNRHCLQ